MTFALATAGVWRGLGAKISVFLETNAGTIVILIEENDPPSLKRALKLRQRITIGVSAILVSAHRRSRHASFFCEISHPPSQRRASHLQLRTRDHSCRLLRGES
jgi:hypothetical protein